MTDIKFLNPFMSNPFLLFIINPISGGIDKRDLEDFIEDFCNKKGLEFHIMKTSGKDDARKIKEALDPFQPSIIVACGGDGTITLIANQLIGEDCKLAIFPLGSANGLAYEMGIPDDWEENLNMLIEPKTVTIDAVRINETHLSLHLSDVGFNANLIREFESEGTRGKAAYARSFFKIFMRRKAGRFSIFLNGKTVHHKAEMIVIANASSYGTGAVVNPRCDMSDGLFEVCVFKPLPWYKMLELTWHSFVGHLEKSEYYALYQTNRVEIKSTRAHAVQVDGEVIGKMKEIRADVLKAAIQVVVP